MTHHSAHVWTWTKVDGASAAWESPDRRWIAYMRDAAWILRDRTLPTDPREHHRDQERAFYTGGQMLDFIDRHTLED